MSSLKNPPTISNVSGEDVDVEAVLRFLDAVRKGGRINMFGAAPYIQREFRVTSKDALTLQAYWMETFSERHPG